MRIHIYSRAFAPAVGGMEMLMELLAREFHRQGHAVEVVTETPGNAESPFPVHRRPGFLRYIRIARRGDAILSAPLSLRRLAPQLLARRRLVLVHPLLFPDGGLAARLKRIAVRHFTNIVPSHFMARHFPRAVVIGNPYDSSVFSWPSAPAPRAKVLFVGRLIPEKGCDLLLRAFAQVAAEHADAKLTVAGDGEERGALTRLAAELGIAARVTFLGSVTGPALAATLREHGTMVVPTLCEEAFGIVALEGLASGCRMIVAESGGLPEAVGPLALTFPIRDAAALTGCLEQALDPGDTGPSRQETADWLEDFTPERVAARYLEVLSASQPRR